MRLSWNLLAGLANSAWTAVVGLAATPFYLRYLGVDAYGLIGFFTTLLALLQLLDMGLSPAMNREVARAPTNGGMPPLRLRNLLRSLETIYGAVALCIALLVCVSAGWIGHRWLQSTRVGPQQVTHAVMLMGLVVAARWAIGLYQGTLMGAQRVVLASAITMAMTVLAAVGAIFVLAFVSPTIEAFFVWQLAMGLLFTGVMRWAAWRTLGGSRESRFDREELRSVWRFSAGMTGIAVSGVILSQLDKVLLSRLVGLDGFGRYMLATTLAGGLYLLVTPVFNVMYPRFTALAAREDTRNLVELYGLGTRLIAILLFSVAAAVVVFARPLVQLWTGNAPLAASVAPVVSLLTLGSAIHGVMYFPYALQLAFGRPRLALAINLVLIVLMIPLTVTLTLRYAEYGAAAAWLILHLVYLAFGTWLTHRYLLKGQGARWLLCDVGIPWAVALAVAVLANQFLLARLADTRWGALSGSGLVALAAAGVSVGLSPALRASLLENAVSVIRRLR